MRGATLIRIKDKMTAEEISNRSKKGWSNLTPEQRSERAKLMKKNSKNG
jgi:hypothetical protein